MYAGSRQSHQSGHQNGRGGGLALIHRSTNHKLSSLRLRTDAILFYQRKFYCFTAILEHIRANYTQFMI